MRRSGSYALVLMLPVLMPVMLPVSAMAQGAIQPRGPEIGVELLRSPQALFDKRFLLTEEYPELFLMLPRAPGTGRIVLVRPDGSKEYAGRHSDSVDWQSSRQLDVIRLINPEQGPWQLHMKLPPGQPFYLIPDFDLISNRLPEVIYQGEDLDLSAAAEFAGQPVLAPLFGMGKFQVRISEGHPEREPVFLVAAIPDLDVATEPGDSDSQISAFIDVRPGLYDLRLQLDIGVARREFRHRFEVREPPFTQQLVKAENYLLPHQVMIELAPEGSAAYDAQSLIFTGEATLPDGRQQPIRLAVGRRWPKAANIEVSPEGGIYQLSLDVTGRYQDGRELEMRLPTFRFATPPDPLWLMEQQAFQAREQARVQQLPPPPVYQQVLTARVSGGMTLVLIIGGNLLLFLVVGLLFWLRQRQPARKTG